MGYLDEMGYLVEISIHKSGTTMQLNANHYSI
jgi:hypothetical protein